MRWLQSCEGRSPKRLCSHRAVCVGGPSRGHPEHLLGYYGQARGVVCRQFARPMKQRQRGVHITVHPDPGANIVVTELVCRDLQTQTLEADAVVVVHRALRLLTQDVRQVAADERYIGRAWHGAGYTKLPVVGGSVDLLQIPVGAVHVRNASSGKFLRQAALVRLKRPSWHYG